MSMFFSIILSFFHVKSYSYETQYLKGELARIRLDIPVTDGRISDKTKGNRKNEIVSNNLEREDHSEVEHQLEHSQLEVDRVRPRPFSGALSYFSL